VLVGYAGDVPGGLCSYYSGNATYSENMTLKDTNKYLAGPNVGQYYDNTTLRRQNTSNVFAGWNNGSRTIQLLGPGFYNATIANGDKLWFLNYNVDRPGGEFSLGPDQLQSDVEYTIANVNNTGSPVTFEIINPATGLPFTSYTYQGAPFTQTNSNTNVGFHFNACPSTSYDSGQGGYALYIGSIASALKITGQGSVSFLGKTVNNAYNTLWNVRGLEGAADQTWLMWDGTLTVP
jgi:hypothetical protein